MLGSKKGGAAGGTTLIAHGTVVVGDVRFSGSLDIEGLVQGNVLADAGSDALVRVLGKGRVEGEIHAPNVVVNGAVHGDVHSTGQIELASKARVQGNVYYTLVEMAAGAEVIGGMSRLAEAPGRAEVAAPAAASDSQAPEEGGGYS